VGLGPGAWSTVGSLRVRNQPDLAAYVRGIMEHGVPPRDEERLGERERRNEFVMLRLRQRSGFSLREFRETLGVDCVQEQGESLTRLVRWGLLRVEGDSVCLSLDGLCVADRVIAELMV
jgi:oxygen-independent coproporphyrinogen-3 oxidase